MFVFIFHSGRFQKAYHRPYHNSSLDFMTQNIQGSKMHTCIYTMPVYTHAGNPNSSLSIIYLNQVLWLVGGNNA